MAFALSAAHPGTPAIPRPTALSGGYRPMRIFSSSSFSSFGTSASLSISMLNSVSRKKCLVNDCKAFRIILCFASKRQGFGPEPTKRDKSSTGKTPKERLSVSSETGKFMTARPTSRKGQAPGLGADSVEKPGNILSDREFMERLEAVRRSTLEQKKAEVNKFTQAIDYDAPIESKKNTIGLGTRVGVGIAVVVFGLVFAFGDFLPSISLNSNEEAQIVEKKLSDEEKAVLQTRLQSYEATLGVSPDDLSALEGAAVTSAELGEYKQASALLEKLTKERPEDSEAYRLLGEVKYALKDYEGSATSYRNSLSASRNNNFESLRGLTNALLAAKKPEEAVQVLVSYSENLNDINPNGAGVSAESKDVQNIDPIQVQLLLGKAYSDWGHVSDAVAVYDQLISKYPNDFRGYLAKGIILKENGKAGDAERMFIQARFFAPEKVKVLVDRYSGK